MVRDFGLKMSGAWSKLGCCCSIPHVLASPQPFGKDGRPVVSSFSSSAWSGKPFRVQGFRVGV